MLDAHLRKTSDGAEYRRLREDLPGLKNTLTAITPVLVDACRSENPEIWPRMYELLGRIVAFARMTQDQMLREAIEPARSRAVSRS